MANDAQAAFDKAIHDLKVKHLADFQQVERDFNATIKEVYETGKGLTLTAKESPRPRLQEYRIKASNTVPLSARQPAK